MYSLIILAVSIAATASDRSVEYFDLGDAHIHFNDFITKFNKQYIHEQEKEFRFQIFKKNLADINRLNKESAHAVYGNYNILLNCPITYKVYTNLNFCRIHL